MCFVPLPTMGLFAKSIEPLLSPNNVSGSGRGTRSSSVMFRYQAACTAAWERAIYSASVDESETTRWRREDQEIAAPHRKNTNAPVERRSASEAAQSESECAVIFASRAPL